MIPNINLVPNVNRKTSESKLIYIILGIVVLLALSLFVWQYFSARSDYEDYKVKNQLLTTQKSELEGKKVQLVSGKKLSLEEQVAYLKELAQPASPLILETQQLLLPNSYLKDYQFEVETLDLLVYFETLSDVTIYLDKLIASDYFTDAKIVQISTDIIGKEVTQSLNTANRQATEISLTVNKDFLLSGGEEQ